MYGTVSAPESNPSHASLLRVLVVDDDAEDRDLITDLLDEVPAVGEVETASTFTEARKQILQARHDVYLVDYRLGARTGLDLITEAAERASGPFIVLTGHASVDVDHMAADVGAQDYLEKDRLSVSMLARSIRYAVSAWTAQAELRRRAERQTALARLSRRALDDPDVAGFLILALDAVTEALRADFGIICELDAGALATRVELGTPTAEGEHLTVPVVHGDGAPWGVLGVQVPGVGTNGDVVFLELVANLIAAVVDRAEVIAHRNRLVEILEATPDFVGTMTIDGTVTFLNGVGRTLHGGDDLGGHPDFRSFYPESVYRMLEQEAIPRAVEDGWWSGRASLLAGDGSEIPVSEVIVAHRDEHGTVTHVSAVAHDLTDDLAAERAASEQIAFQASLLDQVHNAVVATDLAGIVTYWNRAATEMFGLQPDEALGLPMLELVSADREEAARAAAEVTTALLAHGVWEGEGVLRRKDGSTFVARMADSLLYDDERTPVGIIGIKADVTQVREMESAIRRQEALAASVLRSVHFPVAVLDPHGVITAVNRAWIDFGSANGAEPELCGVGADYLAVCRTAGDDPGAAEAHDGIVAVLKGTARSYSLEYECSAPDQERWFELEVHPITGVGAVVVHWNVTAERNQMISLQETLDAKDRFIAALSHELRTPLTAVVGLAEELRSGEHSSDDVREFHALIADQAQELSLLVDDLLVAARIESGAITYRSARISICQELDHVLAPWRRSGFQVAVIGPSDAVAHADPGRVRQVLRNLVSNAIRYGAAPITITVSVGAEVAVSVSDRGRGVPDPVLQRLFEPYSNFAGAEGLTASMGLGLHVSRDLAEGMGGSLTYRREGETTVFELTLPGPN